ncbi:ion channel protein [Gordonia neofelifaecis]|uniref:Putative ion channel protein n=1 Tax=Gordonia neofelifaecis NRRL B-59395 TaxID=644548 RepID=F1YM56_9ACTN|nr:ion channel protein [Gordonia neofelifaecis]EGD54307.1 putative ion channel protein [Gordonia neofelifaecis NRRL B-59395]
MGDTQPDPAEPEEFRVPVGRLIAMTPVGIIVGALCALGLWGISVVAGLVQKLVWDHLSSALGVDPDSGWWIVTILTCAGLLSGLVIRYVPGHAGNDPAAAGLVSAPLAPKVLPGLVIATILTLAGGVSLGPENPIMAINAAIIVALGARLVPKVGQQEWMGLSTAATIGSLFGTPVAAALMISEANSGDPRVPLWNRLYVPLVAAATGSYVILHFTDLDLSIGLPQEEVGGVIHVLIAIGIAIVVAGVGVIGAIVFDPLHRVLNATMRSPVLRLTVGGLVLGLLGAVDGTITLFKGLDEMKELPGEMATTTAVGFFVLAGIKLCAMLIASASGFRGGRIFPAVFVGAAMGFGIHAMWSSVPLTLCAAASVVGLSVAATRNGWISVFLGLAIVPQFDLFVPLLFATLAAWLLVANAPELTAKPLALRRAADPAVKGA